MAIVEYLKFIAESEKTHVIYFEERREEILSKPDNLTYIQEENYWFQYVHYTTI